MSVMFAVLLAFAVDQWREDRSNTELAARARASILAEIAANRSELLDSRSQHDNLRQQLTQNLEEFEAGERSDSQSAILDQIGNFGAAAAEAGDVGAVLAALAGRMEILLDLQAGLIEAYETVLEEAAEEGGT